MGHGVETFEGEVGSCFLVLHSTRPTLFQHGFWLAVWQWRHPGREEQTFLQSFSLLRWTFWFQYLKQFRIFAASVNMTCTVNSSQTNSILMCSHLRSIIYLYSSTYSNSILIFLCLGTICWLMIIVVKLLGVDSCWLGGTSNNTGTETESSFRFGESEVRTGLEKINTFGEGGVSIGGRTVAWRN